MLAAASIAVKLAKDADFEELCALIELASLLRHNLEGIKIRRICLKLDKKFGDGGGSDDD